MTYKPVDRQILITTEAPSTNPPNGIVYQWVDNDGFLHQLDSNGNNQRYVNLEELNQKVATSDIVDNLTSTDTDKPLSANQGKLLQDNKEDADSTILKEGDVEDSLNSTSTTKPLSANQGKVLQDGKEDADSTILKESDVENTLSSTSTTKPLSANQGKQLEDNKADTSSLGSMASQDSDNVDITGGDAVFNSLRSSTTRLGDNIRYVEDYLNVSPNTDSHLFGLPDRFNRYGVYVELTVYVQQSAREDRMAKFLITATQFGGDDAPEFRTSTIHMTSSNPGNSSRRVEDIVISGDVAPNNIAININVTGPASNYDVHYIAMISDALPA